MSNVIEYKCPHCGGVLEFDSSIQQMKCPYCDSTVTVEEASQDSYLNDTRPDVTGTTFGDEDSEFSLYHCSSCGAEIIADDTTAAMHCPYCDNPVILTGRIAGELKPELIIPFKVTKDEAKAALRKHFEGKKLLPAVFADENHLDEIKGVYLPFWLYDTDAVCDARYRTTKVRTWADRDFNYTETSYFDVTRSGTMGFASIPVDALKDVENDLTESLEVFNAGGAVPFNTAYLSGYFANRYDDSAEDCLARARERIVNSITDRVDDTVNGYSSVTRQSCQTNLYGTTAKYAFFPVWILHTSWRGESYLFAMNGQSGKFVGNLPMDKKKYWIQRLLWGAGFSVIIFILWQLITGGFPI